MAIPAAIIFVNNDLTDSVKNMLVRQLYINNTYTGAEFDSIISNDPNYPSKVQQLDQRIMVVRSFEEKTNRDLADVVCFVKNGLIAIERNKFGPPGTTYPVVNIHWGKLCIYEVWKERGACCQS